MPADEIVVFDDAAAAVAAILRQSMPDVFTGNKIPHDREKWPNVIVIVRTGGTSRDVVIDDAQITLDCWAGTGAAAHDLAQLARGHLNANQGQTVEWDNAGELRRTSILHVREFSGPALVHDPTSGAPRYRQSFQVGVRGAAIQ